jgi:ABC-type dipeptide/oligopeptide/nickel transport system permease subunit
MPSSPSDLSEARAVATSNRPSAAGPRLSRGGKIGMAALLAILLTCLLTLPITLVRRAEPGYAALGDAAPMTALYERQNRAALRLPPSWWPTDDPDLLARRQQAAADVALRVMADQQGLTLDKLVEQRAADPSAPQLPPRAAPTFLLGTDHLGRSVLARCLVGGTISLAIGIAAAALSMSIGVMYGAIAGYLGGRADNLMMRVVDVLYGLPYVLLVVLLAVAVDGAIDRWQAARVATIRADSAAFVQAGLDALAPAVRADPAQLAAQTAQLSAKAREAFGSGEISQTGKQAINIVTLLVAIGGVSWLTMARVIRGQVLSLKAQPFMEAARAIGVPVTGQFKRHLLPNLIGPIVVYATLTVPQAILQESFLSFLGIGVKPPLPSWGNLAADALTELNTVRSHWWMLLFPCLLLATTLLALNFMGEALRDKLDPKRKAR